MMHFQRNRWIYLSIFLYLLFTAALAISSYSKEKHNLFSILDLRLETAALTLPSLLPRNFHHNDMKNDRSVAERNQTISRQLTRYADKEHISNIYTLILRNNQVYFTSSNATQLDQHADSEGPYSVSNVDFLAVYNDAPPALLQAFSTQQPIFSEYADKWGKFRSVFIPLHAGDGSLYVAAADINTRNINQQLSHNFYRTIILSVFFILLLFLLFRAHINAYQQKVILLRARITSHTTALEQSEAKLESILEHSPIGIFHFNKQGDLLKTNHHFENMIGVQREQLTNFNILSSLINPEIVAAMHQALQGKVGKFNGHYTSVLTNKEAYLKADFVPFYSHDGRLDGGVGVCADITTQHQITTNLKKLSRVVECSLDGILITDTEGVIEYINPQFTHLTGYSAAEAIGQKANFFRSGNTAMCLYDVMWETIINGQKWNGELQNKKKNNELYWANLTIVPMTDTAGKVTHFIGIQNDITESRIAAQKIAYQARHDMLTGLINRYEFERSLSKAVFSAQQYNNSHILCFLDLDQFKIINDTSGHAAGDELLRQLSSLLSSHIQRQDTLARLGGDEFAILIPHCKLPQAITMANRIIDKVNNFQFMWQQHSFTIGISIGLAEITSHTGNVSEVLRHADIAYIAAKDGGRNRVHSYQPDSELVARRDGDFHWVNQIKEALNEDRFVLYAQPIEALALPNQQRVFEVLLRMVDKHGGIISPTSFLPVAERYNLAPRIDRWVIEHVFSWMKHNRQQLEDVTYLSINLSGASLDDHDLLTYIMQAISAAQLAPQQIMFEITETVAIGNLTAATLFVNTLTDFGCQFALDDFGSGLSSFAYLKNLPVSTLKIDGLFIKDILTNPLDSAMVKSINEMGHLMQLKTVAEFVENDAIKQQLKTIGIDYVQGYGIGRPVPINTILQAPENQL